MSRTRHPFWWWTVWPWPCLDCSYHKWKKAGNWPFAIQRALLIIIRRLFHFDLINGRKRLRSGRAVNKTVIAIQHGNYFFHTIRICNQRYDLENDRQAVLKTNQTCYRTMPINIPKKTIRHWCIPEAAGLVFFSGFYPAETGNGEDDAWNSFHPNGKRYNILSVGLKVKASSHIMCTGIITGNGKAFQFPFLFLLRPFFPRLLRISLCLPGWLIGAG